MPIYNEFFHLFLQVSRSFTKKTNEKLAPLNMFQTQWSIMYYLYNNEAPTLVEISNYFNVEKPTITRTVNRLEERGLIEQVPGKDKRERRIQLTTEGVHAFEEGKEIIDENERNLMKNIPEAHREITRQTLRQLQKNLKECRYEQ